MLLDLSRNRTETRGLPLEIRAVTKDKDGVPTKFTARVLKYGVRDSYGTKFREGVFTEGLKTRLPRLLYGHNGWGSITNVLGRAVGYKDSPEGLDVDFEFADFEHAPEAKRAAIFLRDGVLDQFSVGFSRAKELRDEEDDTVWIEEGNLAEVSIVIEGAVPGTSLLGMRSADGTAAEPVISAAVAARLITRLGLGDLDLADALTELKGAATAMANEPSETQKQNEHIKETTPPAPTETTPDPMVEGTPPAPTETTPDQVNPDAVEGTPPRIEDEAALEAALEAEIADALKVLAHA